MDITLFVIYSPLDGHLVLLEACFRHLPRTYISLSYSSLPAEPEGHPEAKSLGLLRLFLSMTPALSMPEAFSIPWHVPEVLKALILLYISFSSLFLPNLFSLAIGCLDC